MSLDETTIMELQEGEQGHLERDDEAEDDDDVTELFRIN